MTAASDRYAPLLEAFVSGQLNADEFQDRFLNWWREDRDSGITTGEVIDNLMVGVDAYDRNPDLPLRIDAEQLRTECADALRLLTAR